MINLPQYDPPQRTWHNIEAELDKLDKLATLPTYDPSDALWERIEADLNDSKLVVAHSKLKTRNSKLVWWGIAALLAILVVASLWFFNQNKIEKTATETLTVSTETVDNQLFVKEAKDDEAAFAMVEAFCEVQIEACKTPEFIALKHDLDELNAAREELKSAMGDYNTDPNLVAELTQIEQERTGILNQLLAVSYEH
jgi:hypothetical protein